MREDMFKVIVERPRWGRKYAARSKLRYDKVPDRKHATGRRLVLEHRGYTKDLNENLAPLKRYLHKQVGRPWDKVYSEISQHLDASSTVKQHVRDHLTDFILVKVTRDSDGGLMAPNHWGGPMPPERWWAELYVDPDNGLIKRTAKLCRKLGRTHYREKLRADRKRRATGWRYDHNLRVRTETCVLVKLKGCWFQVDCDHPPTGRFGHHLQGPDLVKALAGGGPEEGGAWRVIAKRQLGKKELRAHKLEND